MPKFPFTNYHELNLDWILKKVTALFDASEENAQTIRTYETRLTAAEQTATSAATAATAAQQLADAASENADSALSVAGTADSKADSALTAATNAADAVAGALTTAQEAQQTAAAAVATANDAAATASSLESLANTANQNATAALETAQTADQKAVAAQSAAATADQKAVAAQTTATTNAGNITTLQTDVSNLNRQISDVKSAFEESLEYVEIPIPWHVSSNYPTGWARGYYTGDIGETYNNNLNTSYMRAQYAVKEGNYPTFAEATYLEVTPPSGCCVRIKEIEVGTNIVTRVIGQINSDTYPELAGVSQRIDAKNNREYRIDLGKFASGATYYEDPTFVSQIKICFIVPKKNAVALPNINTGTASKNDNMQFFTVEVERPLSFGGEDINLTTETVECVLQLPDSYRVEGDPTPLVLLCHGATGYIQESTRSWYNTNWKTFADTLSAAGFALFDVNVLPSSTGTDQMGYCVGSPLAVNVAKAAYDYIVKNYNVQKKILVHGTSMGGVLASAFVKAYPQICLAQSSFAGRDLIHYIYTMTEGTFADAEKFAVSYGYTDYASLVADKFSHAEGLTPSLTLKKYTSGVASLPPDRETDFQSWLDYFAELESHGKDDVIGDYTAYRPVPYKSWNSWADNIGCTKAEQILQKAYATGGSAPYLCVYYDSGTHTEMSYGQINDMIPQLIAWYKRWLP